MIDSSGVLDELTMLAADTVLQGRYRIIRQLGQGGMGAVYEAVDERLDTTVALKETLFTDDKLRKQFEREARLLARMHHPALPRVSDHFNESDGQFLVMQYIAGEDLAEMLAQRQGPFSQGEVLRWAEQLCDALDYLHTQDPQIIHRDIKPQNLKLTARGQIVLLDFGLAKGSAGQMSVVTTSASIFGYTPNYAPLEQIQGLGTDPRSDIYALSATLFHLLTNVKPPDALSRASAIVNGLPDPLPLANVVNLQVSAAVAAVLSRGMSQKRDDRFASASAMSEALAAISGNSLGEAATVLVGGAATAAGTPAREPATLIAGAKTTPMASEAQTLFAADATSVRKPVSGSETATLVHAAPGVTSATGSRKWIGALVLLVLIVGGAGGFYAYRRHQSQQAVSPVTTNPVQAPVPTQTPNDPKLDATQTEPTKSVETKIEKQAESTQRASTSKQRAEKAATTKPEKDEQPLTHDQSRDPNRDANRDSRQPPPPFPSPNDPRFDPFRNGRHPPEVDRSKLPQVRTLPNGTRIVIQPDGTRIITGPKGKVQVIPPGDRPRRDRP